MKFIYELTDLENYDGKTDSLDWKQVSVHKSLSEDFMKKFKDDLEWTRLSILQSMSEDFIRDMKDYVDWYHIIRNKRLSEKLLKEVKDSIEDWEYISQEYPLSEDFMREMRDYLDWHNLSAHQKLSEDFIREMKDYVVWSNIAIYQKLSETFIIEMYDYLDSFLIPKYQELSESFLEKTIGYFNWGTILKFQNLSDDFIAKHKIKIDKDSWRYKSTEFKKNKVLETGLYECYDDYFIAFKQIRENRYSLINYQYRYLPNETYETFADYTNVRNSFGFSAGTEEEVKTFKTGMTIKVKIYYKDVARVDKDGKYIRCSKLNILN